MSAALLAAALLAAATPDASATPCTRPDRAPMTVRAMEPEVPWSIARFGFSGTVDVVVTVDASNTVVAAQLRSSPFGGLAVPLNAIALDAARRSTFQGAVHDCVQRTESYVYMVEFPNAFPLAYVERAAKPPRVTVNGRGVVAKAERHASRDADVATATQRAIADANDAAQVLASASGVRVLHLLSQTARAVDAKNSDGFPDAPLAPGDLVVYVRASYEITP